MLFQHAMQQTLQLVVADARQCPSVTLVDLVAIVNSLRRMNIAILPACGNCYWTRWGYKRLSADVSNDKLGRLPNRRAIRSVLKSQRQAQQRWTRLVLSAICRFQSSEAACDGFTVLVEPLAIKFCAPPQAECIIPAMTKHICSAMHCLCC